MTEKTYLENAEIMIRGTVVTVLTRPQGQPTYRNFRTANAQTAKALYEKLVREHIDENGE